MTIRKRYHDLRQLSADASGRDLYVIVPFEETVTLVAESASLALSDKDTKRLPGDSQRVPLHIPMGGSAPAVTLNVAKR